MQEVKNIFLIGIGGIGMSALARYFHEQGCAVSGYDHVEKPLTRQLTSEGMRITYEDDIKQLDSKADLVILTPAIHEDNKILTWYRQNGFSVKKRSEVLHTLTEGKNCVAISGTHGKTTITTLMAHLLRSAGKPSRAFLGGISVNYDTNFWTLGNPDWVVVEADEYDRSFLRLEPNIAVITAMDPDHLDIYGTPEAVVEAFGAFSQKIKPGGTLWYKHGLSGSLLKADHKFTYSLQNDAANAWADNIVTGKGGYDFDWKDNSGDVIEGLRLNLGGMHNVENAVVAIAIARSLGLKEEEIRTGIASFSGVKRRFEYIIRNEKVVYIDDYAHHPKELESLIKSTKRLFPKRKCVVAFQPHLYSRTRDLADGFAQSLSLADQVILLPIYPAREEPIPGVTSEMIKDKMSLSACTVLTKEGLLAFVEKAPLDLFITAGAGDIDQLVEPIKKILS